MTEEPRLQSSNKGIACWVTDASYVDPQDGSPAQFIAVGTKAWGEL